VVKVKQVLLIEDHTLFREGLALLLEWRLGLESIEAGSLAEGRRVLGAAKGMADLVIIDLDLPDGDGLELIEDLSSKAPQIMILVLSASLELGRFARAIEAGAGGVLHKSTPIKEIIEAVRRLRAGEALLSPGEVIGKLSPLSWEREEKREALQAIGRLTSREREILWALAEGLESREIAQRLNITVETERTHVDNILHKLGVHSRLQALIFAVRYGIVEIR
jgi:DNA-binding NarL/FixJ family response regulator